MKNNIRRIIFLNLIFVFLTYGVFSADTIKISTIGDEKVRRHLLHNEICDDINPRWSPDGKIIAFERISRGKSYSQGIYYFELQTYLIKPIQEVKGEKVKKFESELDFYDETLESTPEELYASYFNWIPTGEKFIYTEGLNLYTGGIDKGKLDTPQLFTYWKRINQEKYNGIPFISYLEGKKRLYLLKKDGDGAKELVVSSLKETQGEFVSNKYPDCSKNGDVVFVSGLTGNGDLYLLSLKDKHKLENLKRLTFSNEVDTTPKWSPDGTKIVYSSHEKGNMNIYLLINPKDEIKKVQLTDWQMEELNPTWSPDGEKIAFYTLKKDKNIIDLWVMDSDGKNKKNIATNVLRNEKYGPCWLPAQFGRKLIYISEHGDSLYIGDADSGEKWRIDVGNVVMSDVSCAPYQSYHNKNLIIAYSAQHTNGRKRIFIKKIFIEGLKIY